MFVSTSIQNVILIFFSSCPNVITVDAEENKSLATGSDVKNIIDSIGHFDSVGFARVGIDLGYKTIDSTESDSNPINPIRIRGLRLFIFRAYYPCINYKKLYNRRRVDLSRFDSRSSRSVLLIRIRMPGAGSGALPPPHPSQCRSHPS
ncbi:hypothetical protein PR003_g33751, partial [Phytophthora rubi]